MKYRSKIVFHADDLGLTKGFNQGIKLAYKNGVLQSTCIRTNGPFFRDAIDKVIPDCKELSVGLHLNLVEGKSHLSNPMSFDQICDKKGFFKYKFFGLLLKSFNKKFLIQIEEELRAQFEIANKNLKKIDHINSHQHCCAIPNIFEITCKLAKEFNVKTVRIADEKFFFSGTLFKHLNSAYFLNLIKWLVLKTCSFFNRATAKKYTLNYPDCFIGILYTDFMNPTVCIDAINKTNKYDLVEILLHPATYDGGLDEKYLSSEVRDYCLSPSRNIELQTLISDQLISFIKKNKIIISNFDRSIQKKIMYKLDNEIFTKKKVFLIFDETNFYHPGLIHKLTREDKTIQIVGVGIVKLDYGGKLQAHFIKNLFYIGLLQIALLTIKSLFISITGLLPKFIKGDFYSSCKQVVIANKIEFKITKNVNNYNFKSWVSNLEPDFIISSNSLLFDEDLINIPSKACINRHSSLLPSNAGILPVYRSLLKNETHTGVTIHSMTKKIDEGKILNQFSIPIFPNDTLTKLYKLCFEVSFILIIDTINNFSKLSSKKDNSITHQFPKSYYSFPTKNEWKKFKKNGLRFL